MNPTSNSYPLIKQGWLRAVVFVLLFIGLAVLIAGFASYMMVRAHLFDPAKGPGPFAITILMLINSAVGIGVTTLFRRLFDRKTVMSMGFQWKQFQPDAIVGLCFGIALPMLGTLILYAIKKLQWSEVNFSGSDLFIALVMMALVALSEEMVFRGYILNNLMESMNKWAALGISALVFALAHGGNTGISALAIINLILGGLLLGVNYIYTRNLWFALCFHFSWNFIQGPVLGYEVSGIHEVSLLQQELKGAGWVTGGAFGFEGSFIATVLFIATLAALYLVYEKPAVVRLKP